MIILNIEIILHYNFGSQQGFLVMVFLSFYPKSNISKSEYILLNKICRSFNAIVFWANTILKEMYNVKKFYY
jgi:hypothetical protein